MRKTALKFGLWLIAAVVLWIAASPGVFGQPPAEKTDLAGQSAESTEAAPDAKAAEPQKDDHPPQPAADAAHAGDPHDAHGGPSADHPAEAHAAGGHGHDAASLGKQVSTLSTIPFALILLCIALFPLFAEHWWEHNSNKAIIAAVLATPVAAYLLIAFGSAGWHQLEEKILEYISFIVMLAALFVISGGIYVKGSLSGTPLLNTLLLALGASIASFVGTTGASMLLIRPLLRANKPRQNKAHIVVFFIFIVSNCGGLLTPLGDPPLFLGFLSGVPFLWTFGLWKHWLVVNGLLLVIFNVYDQMVFDKEEKERPGSQLEQVQVHEPMGISGGFNLLLLLGVVLTIYASGQGIGNGGFKWQTGIAETILAILGVLSYVLTPKTIHEQNKFSFGPINEVAILFAGIFVTMIPALLLLNAHGKELGVNEPWEFFWATGFLSSFLDNAPTYLTFAAAACGMENIPLEGPFMRVFLDKGGTAAATLTAISCGAVFMGANTYIGNGPNFMVKAIAEKDGIHMPSFFGYMLYAIAFLVPVFIVVTAIFFR